MLKKNDEEQKSAFEQLEREMFYGDHEKRKRDNETIFLFGVPNVISMFQACLVVGLEPRLWERFIDTYFRIKKVECITCELVEALTYCEVHSKELYLSILCKFNKLKIKGNMNDKKVYIRFLQKYLRLMFQFGYTRMNGGNSLENLDKMTEGFMEEWIDPLVLDELCDMRNRLPIQGIREDIQILIMFVEKNKDMIKNKEKLEPRKNFDARFGTISQESPVKRINAFTGTDEEFYKLVKDAYDKDEISAYEVGLLDRLQKEEDIERFN